MQRIRNQQSGSAGKYKTTPLSLRTTRYGMVPNSIENLSQLTIDAQTKLALTTASVKLTIEVDAAGTRVFLADQRSGQMIGGPDDLSKLSGIRAFITRERKDAAGIEIAKRIGEISFKCSQNLISRNPTYVQPPLETNYSATLRPLLIVLERLELNKQKFLENTNLDKREIFEPILKDMFTRIRNAYFAYMIELTTGESKKGMLNTCLFDRGVPEYVHTKLTSQNLILERSQELTRLLFPQDPSKGLQLTVKEWRSLEFRKLLGTYLLRSSGATEKLMRSDAFIRALAKLDHTVDLNDESNVTVQKLLKNRVHVIPPMQESKYVTDAGMKMKGGWKFMTPSTETAQGCLTAVGLAILRIYSATVQSVDLVDDYYQIVANGEVKRSNLSPTNNFFVQWSNSSSDDKNWNEVVTGNGTNDELREALWRWTRLELRLSEKGEVGLQLANVLGLSEDLKTIRPKVSEVPAGHNRNKSDTQKRTVDRVEYKPKIQIDMFEWKSTSPMVGLSDVLAKVEPKDEFFVSEYIKKIFPKKKILGKDKKQNNANLTVLTKDSKSLLKQVEKLSKPLSLRMSIWLRSFSDERLQNAASKLALAQFDELFINENIIEEDDQNENDSDAEDSEEEFPE